MVFIDSVNNIGVKFMIEKLFMYIHDFIETTEYSNIKISEPEIAFVNDIKECIMVDDPEYSDRIKGNPSGVFYISSTNLPYLLILRTDEMDAIWQTIYHEMIHYYDFYMYSIESNIIDYRKLQDDTFFVFWSEFHADYLSWKYIYNKYKSLIVPINEANNIINDVEIFLKNNRYLHDVINHLVRRYGQYMAFC